MNQSFAFEDEDKFSFAFPRNKLRARLRRGKKAQKLPATQTKTSVGNEVLLGRDLVERIKIEEIEKFRNFQQNVILGVSPISVAD